MKVADCFSLKHLAAFRHSYDPPTSEKVDLLDERFLLAREGRYSVYYAPFGAASSPDTRVIFVGLTPGLSQLQLAAELFRSCKSETAMDPVAFARLLRSEVAFAGSMRKNLCAMLEDLGLPLLFGAEDAADLFSAARNDVATTSALQYPVFVGPHNVNSAERRTYQSLHFSVKCSICYYFLRFWPLPERLSFRSETRRAGSSSSGALPTT